MSAAVYKLLGFVISKDFDWGLVLADDSLDFELGTTEAVLLSIDARDPIPAIAKVVDVHGIVIPLENSDPVLDALRHGQVLTITAETAKVSFKLTGTKDAIKLGYGKLDGLAVVRSRPSNVAAPDSGRIRPESAFRMVDFPAPLAPMSATTSPAATRSEAPRTAFTGP